jgi:hypothetical protein
MIRPATEFLLGSQNRDGGWAMHEGRDSNTEATSFATLALARQDGSAERASAARGMRWLAVRQNDDGSWPLNARVADGSWTTALAALTLVSVDGAGAGAVRGARWLLRQEPRRPGLLVSLLHRLAPEAMPVRHDPNLRGWSWTADAASFVEPTAYTLLALKKLRRALPGTHVSERINEAESLIYDRMCKGGGWNYGNSTVLEADLWPYADVTALTLIALADHRSREANERSLTTLRRMVEGVDSGLTLAWAILCFAAYGQDTTSLRARLAARWRRTAFLGETKSVALGLLALTGRAAAVTP